MHDPMAARFRNKLEPWQMSAKLFDFDPGFVRWICRYLDERKLPCEATDAKAWINKGFFALERYELVTLQWEAYETKKGDRERLLSSGATSGGAIPEPRAVGRSVDDGVMPDAPLKISREQQAANIRRLREMVEKHKIGGNHEN